MSGLDGQRLYMRKLPEELEVIKKALDPFTADLKGIIVESTYNWHWLVDELQDAGCRVHRANPTAGHKGESLLSAPIEWETRIYFIVERVRQEF
jgi:hypothetical protein